MKPIKKLNDLLDTLTKDYTPRVAVAAAQDTDTIIACNRAVEKNIVKAIFIGDKDKIETIIKEKNFDMSNFDIIPEKDETEATLKAVDLVKEKNADILMRGLGKTEVYLKSILDKDHGLIPSGGFLSHVAVMDIPSYPKLLMISDAAIIPNPNFDEKIKILKYTIEIARTLGNNLPKIALVSATETISFKVQSSVDAAVITAMAQRKQIKGAVIDGPLALDVSISPEKCKIKGLDSPINGEADILLFPNFETANTFYKSMTLLAQGTAASILVGSTDPIALTSRADSIDSKFYSIIFAAHLAVHNYKKNK
ncbi:MAG: phosphate acyltransferase [bacterium]